MEYHMRDLKRLNADADERDEARHIGYITLFYMLVIIAFVLVY